MRESDGSVVCASGTINAHGGRFRWSEQGQSLDRALAERMRATILAAAEPDMRVVDIAGQAGCSNAEVRAVLHEAGWTVERGVVVRWGGEEACAPAAPPDRARRRFQKSKEVV